MIVQCPSCASRYRIRDANIPPSGGKIRCPSCSHAFIVYPEAGEDEDKTNITSQGEISQLINKMSGQRTDQAGLGAQDEDYVSTQIATSDQARAAQAMATELGDPMDMDGTVEIQNPMKVWKQAQDAMKAAQQAATDDDEDEWDDFAATEVVDPSALDFAQLQQQPVLPPTTEVSREELADAFGVAATSGMFTAAPKADGPPAGQPHQQPPTQIQPQQQQQPPPEGYPSQYGSGAADGYGSGQYAPSTPNTPPGGRSTHESWDQMQPPSATEPHEQVNAFAQQQQQQQQMQPPQQNGPPQTQQPQMQQRQQWGGGQQGFQRSPSGLTSAALFDDPIPEDDPVHADPGFAPPFGGQGSPQAPSNPMQQQQQQPPYQQQQPPQNAAAGDGHPGPWKLKTNFGLTYEFPDTKGLRSWLSSREELDGFTVSSDDGASFHALGAFPQLSGPRTASSSGMSSMQPPSHGSGSFDQPPQYGWGQVGNSPSQAGPEAFGSGLHQASDASSSQIKGPRVNNEYRPPSRESKHRGLLWLVFLILFVAAVLIGLQTTGVFKITDVARDHGLLPAQTTKPQTTDVDEPTNTNDAPEVDPEKLAKKQAADVEALLEDTQRLVEGNKLPTALERLDKLEQLASDNPLVFDLRAQVLEKLGKAEEAEAARTTAAGLRGSDPPAPDAGMIEPGEEPSDKIE